MACDAERSSELAQAADRLDELAEVAELMGDEEGAARFRRQSGAARGRAMAILDLLRPPERG